MRADTFQKGKRNNAAILAVSGGTTCESEGFTNVIERPRSPKVHKPSFDNILKDVTTLLAASSLSIDSKKLCFCKSWMQKWNLYDLGGDKNEANRTPMRAALRNQNKNITSASKRRLNTKETRKQEKNMHDAWRHRQKESNKDMGIQQCLRMPTI